MADPFSIVGLVGATLKGVLAAKDFIDTIQRAPRSIKTLGDELSAIAGLLRELGYLADGSDELDMNRIVREPLANCRKVSKQIEKLIQPYVKTTGGITKWGRFAFGFKEGDVLQLQRDLSACKQNLTLAVASADLATTRKVVRGMRRFQNHFGITSSFVAGSDIDERRHEHIKTWMLETETVVEEEEETTLDASGGSYKAVRTMPAQYKDNNYNQTRVAVLSELDRPSSNFTYMQDHRVEQEEDKSKVEVKVKEKPREENASFLGLGKKNEGPKTTHIFRLNELQLVDLSQLASDYVKRLSALYALQQKLKRHSDWVTSVAFSPDSRLLASASKDKTVRVWDVATSVLQQTLERHSGWVNSVAFSPNSRLLASAPRDTMVRLWDTASGTLNPAID